MSDPLGLFAQDDPLQLFETKKAPVGARVNLDLERYNKYKDEVTQYNSGVDIPTSTNPTGVRTKKRIKSFEEFLENERKVSNEKLIKRGKYVAGGLAETAFSLPYNMLGYLNALGAAPFSKKSFEQLLEENMYVPKTEGGEDAIQALGVATQPFGLTPYTMAGPLSARASVAADKLRRTPQPSFEERLNQVTQEPVAPTVPEQPAQPQAPIMVDSAGNAMRPEDLQWRDRAQQMQIDALRPVDDAQAALLEQGIAEQAQAAVDRRQAVLEDEMRLAAGREALMRGNATKLEAQPTGYADWVEGQRQAANTRLPGNNDPLNLGPAKLTKASQYPDINDFPNLLQDEPYRYEGGIDYNTVDTKALPIEVADMLRTGDKTPDPFNRVSYRQNANKMAQPLEDHIANLNRSEALPEDIARMEGEGGVNQGMSRGQRGAIDPRLLEEGFSKLFHGGREFSQWNPRMVGKGEGMAALGPGLYASDNAKLAEIYKKYGDVFDIDDAGNLITTPGVLSELAVDTRNIIDYRAKGNEAKWASATKNLDALGLKASSRGIQGALQHAHSWGLGNEARKAMSDAGIDGMYIQLGGTMGKEIVIFNPDVIAQVSRADTPVEPFKGVARKQRGAIDMQALGFRTGSEADKLVKDLMGNKLRAAIPSGESVIAEAMEAGKDNRQSIMFSAGATLQAMKTNSPLIRGVARIVQGHKNIAEDAIRQFVFPVEEAFRKVKGQNIENLAALLKKEQLERKVLSPEQLNSLGLSEQQLLAYQALDNMHKEAFKAQNDVRVAAGKSPITELEYYMSSRWQGDFRIPLYDDKGRLVWYIAADNKWAADKHAKSVMEKFPGLTQGKMAVVKSSRRGGEIGSIYTDMLDVAGRDNPVVKAIKQWIESDEAAKTELTRGQLKHFEPKGNVRGFIGDRPYEKPRNEAVEYVQSQINYAKNAFYWSELQKAGGEIKKILADENINATQPRNVQYVREYWLDQLGMNEAKFVKALEDTIRSAGISPNQIGRGISNVKNFWVVQKLAANLGFLASNVIQFGMTLPQLADMKVKYGGNVVGSLINGLITGPMMAAGHMTQKNPQFYKAVAMAGGKEFVLNAMKYAEDNSVIARSIYDESPLSNQFSMYAKTMNFAGKTITLPETYLRGSVYMSYVHMLKSSGKFADDLSIFREAEERTNASMGDYREGERAIIFSKMGQLGNAANTLQTFPMNYYNQWSWAAREAGRGNVLPAISMFAVQGYLAGAFGLPLFQEIDKGWEELKDWLAEIDPRAWEKVKNFSLKELVLHTGGADMLYGSLSEDTGIAMTSRAAAPVPSEMVQTPFAPIADMAGMAWDAGKLALDPLDKQKQAQAALSWAPAGATGYLETGPLKDQTSVTRPDGSVVYKKTSNLADRDAVYTRDARDEEIRKYGVRSQKEQVQKDLQYVAGKRAAQTRNVLRDLPDRIYNAARKGDKEDIKEFVELYARLGGDPRSLATGLEREMREEYLTPAERMAAAKKPTVEAVKQYKLMMDTLKELGYAQ